MSARGTASTAAPAPPRMLATGHTSITGIARAAAPVGWLYFGPFCKHFAAPFGLATLGYAAWSLVWLILIIPCGTVTISLLYMAFTGRGSVRLWEGSD